MKGLDSTIARRIMENLGSNGTPPEWGVGLYSVGLEPYMQIIREDYLQTFVREDGGATFKQSTALAHVAPHPKQAPEKPPAASPSTFV